MKTVTCINVARETGHAVLSLDGAEYAVSLDDLQKILADIAGPRPAPATELLRPSLLPKLAQCPRSEERRVGKECRSRWSPYH